MTQCNDIVPLRGLFVPESLPGRRLPPLVRFRTEDPSLRARYDDRTLFYAATWLPERGLLRVYGPRALNFKPLLRAAGYATEHGPLPRPRLRGFKRYVMAEFPLDRGARRLRVTIAGEEQALAIQHQDTQRFAGLNVLYTMSRDNDLDWISDWLRYHHRYHGANALVLADNGSTAYSADDLMERMRSLGFLRAIRIITVPFKHGPSSAICRRASNTRYLPTAIANFSRDLFLSRARAVLSCDVDEIVVSNSGRSIFDACAARRFGLVTMPGYWRFAKAAGVKKIRHADHVWKDPARAKACPTKYAVAPAGPLGQWSWMPHTLEAVPRRWVSGAPEFWFAHCHDISTRWKEGRDAVQDTAAWTRDDQLARLWDGLRS